MGALPRCHWRRDSVTRIAKFAQIALFAGGKPARVKATFSPRPAKTGAPRRTSAQIDRLSIAISPGEGCAHCAISTVNRTISSAFTLPAHKWAKVPLLPSCPACSLSTTVSFYPASQRASRFETRQAHASDHARGHPTPPESLTEAP